MDFEILGDAHLTETIRFTSIAATSAKTLEKRSV